MMNGRLASSGSRRTSLRSSRPLIGTILRSEITSPYFALRSFSSAATPSGASSTFLKPICASRIRIIWATVLESSTTSTDIARSVAIARDPDRDPGFRIAATGDEFDPHVLFTPPHDAAAPADPSVRRQNQIEIVGQGRRAEHRQARSQIGDIPHDASVDLPTGNGAQHRVLRETS